MLYTLLHPDGKMTTTFDIEINGKKNPVKVNNGVVKTTYESIKKYLEKAGWIVSGTEEFND